MDINADMWYVIGFVNNNTLDSPKKTGCIFRQGFCLQTLPNKTNFKPLDLLKKFTNKVYNSKSLVLTAFILRWEP